MEILHKEITDRILKAFYNVYNKMGFGFSEKVYENSMYIELKKLGLKPVRQKRIDVYYDGQHVGEYYADILVNECVILELKAATGIIAEHEAQLLNYLRATDAEVGFLLNFGEKPQFRRMVFLNARKTPKVAA
jgi:GxxExxY protein